MTSIWPPFHQIPMAPVEEQKSLLYVFGYLRGTLALVGFCVFALGRDGWTLGQQLGLFTLFSFVMFVAFFGFVSYKSIVFCEDEVVSAWRVVENPYQGTTLYGRLRESCFFIYFFGLLLKDKWQQRQLVVASPAFVQDVLICIVAGIAAPAFLWLLWAMLVNGTMLISATLFILIKKSLSKTRAHSFRGQLRKSLWYGVQPSLLPATVAGTVYLLINLMPMGLQQLGRTGISPEITFLTAVGCVVVGFWVARSQKLPKSWEIYPISEVPLKLRDVLHGTATFRTECGFSEVCSLKKQIGDTILWASVFVDSKHSTMVVYRTIEGTMKVAAPRGSYGGYLMPPQARPLHFESRVSIGFETIVDRKHVVTVHQGFFECLPPEVTLQEWDTERDFLGAWHQHQEAVSKLGQPPDNPLLKAKDSGLFLLEGEVLPCA